MEKNKIKKPDASLAFNLPPSSVKSHDSQVSSTDFDTCIRFTGEELKELKALVQSVLNEKQIDYDVLKSTLSMQGNASSYQWLEDAAGVCFMNETAQLAAKSERLIERLKNTLSLIENKVCGVCLITAHDKLKNTPGKTIMMNPD